MFFDFNSFLLFKKKMFFYVFGLYMVSLYEGYTHIKMLHKFLPERGPDYSILKKGG